MMTGGQTIVIKIGGSLIEYGRAIIRRLNDFAADKALVVVPGGGPFAMTVRSLADRVSDDAAHWMAVLATHQYGIFLANDEYPVSESLETINKSGVTILLPYRILKNDDVLPHTWDVTSDTIAAFIAHKLGKKCFIKLTDVDGVLNSRGEVVKEVYLRAIRAERTCVDRALPGFLLQHGMQCLIVNGKYPERVKAIIEGKYEDTCCTRLC